MASWTKQWRDGQVVRVTNPLLQLVAYYRFAKISLHSQPCAIPVSTLRLKENTDRARNVAIDGVRRVYVYTLRVRIRVHACISWENKRPTCAQAPFHRSLFLSSFYRDSNRLLLISALSRISRISIQGWKTRRFCQRCRVPGDDNTFYQNGSSQSFKRVNARTHSEANNLFADNSNWDLRVSSRSCYE